MYCSHCGGEIPIGSKCPDCGNKQKRTSYIWLLLTIVFFLFSAGLSYWSYNEINALKLSAETAASKAYEDGYTAGETQGHAAGYAEAYDLGFDDGRQAGYNVGEIAGYNQGYQDGLEKGFEVGSGEEPMKASDTSDQDFLERVSVPNAKSKNKKPQTASSNSEVSHGTNHP